MKTSGPRRGTRTWFLAAALLATLVPRTTAGAGLATLRAKSAATGLGAVIVEPSRLGSAARYAAALHIRAVGQKSVDMTMYELRDPTMDDDLVANRRHGVNVRVILDINREHSQNLRSFQALSAGGVKVVWADTAYEATHQKTITVDRSRSLVLSGNLTPEYYATTRDFGVVDANAADVAALEAVFSADFAHSRIVPSDATDLVWSPSSEAQMLAVIAGARHTLLIENEEMGSSAVTTAIVAAVHRGVRVDITMTSDSLYDSDLDEIVQAGGHVHVYANESRDLYIHAKTTIADAGRSTQLAYVGSINFSSASMDRNRELGIITSVPKIVSELDVVVAGDFADCKASTACKSVA